MNCHGWDKVRKRVKGEGEKEEGAIIKKGEGKVGQLS